MKIIGNNHIFFDMQSHPPIIIEEKKITVEELAGMVARRFDESEKDMKAFIQVSIDNLEYKMNAGFESLHKRFDSISVRHS